MSAPAASAALPRATASSKPTTARASVRAMIDEIAVAAGRGGGADLRQPILARHDLLVVEMAAFLRKALVLDMDAGDAARLVFAHGAHDVELVAVAGIGVGDHRQLDRGGDAAGVVDHLRHRDQAEIGIAERRRGAGAGHVDAVEPGLRDQLRGDAVIGAGCDHHAVPAQQFAKAARLGHRLPPFRLEEAESAARRRPVRVQASLKAPVWRRLATKRPRTPIPSRPRDAGSGTALGIAPG